MSKILGDKNTIESARMAKAGDKTVYINFDAINQLPDEYEVLINEVKFDIKNDFADIGNGNYMPQPHLMYRIAEAKGIQGGENSISEPIIEDVDINPMLMKPLESEPTYRKMTVGRCVKKYATVLQEDGTLLRSSACTCNFNVWERCLELWSKEELYTEGYKKQSQYPPKYDTQYKRRNHFQSEMKFAHAKAETKAHEKAIRELAGLLTGYKLEDLKTGKLYFAKIRRSQSILKAETAARLTALSKGLKAPTENLLFEEPKKSNREILIQTFKHYQNEPMLKQYEALIEPMVLWLEKEENAEKNIALWNKALLNLKTIEDTLPEQGRLKHYLY